MVRNRVPMSSSRSRSRGSRGRAAANIFFLGSSRFLAISSRPRDLEPVVGEPRTAREPVSLAFSLAWTTTITQDCAILSRVESRPRSRVSGCVESRHADRERREEHPLARRVVPPPATSRPRQVPSGNMFRSQRVMVPVGQCARAMLRLDVLDHAVALPKLIEDLITYLITSGVAKRKIPDNASG